jgi:hypothetical protein
MEYPKKMNFFVYDNRFGMVYNYPLTMTTETDVEKAARRIIDKFTETHTAMTKGQTIKIIDLQKPCAILICFADDDIITPSARVLNDVMEYTTKPSPIDHALECAKNTKNNLVITWGVNNEMGGNENG